MVGAKADYGTESISEGPKRLGEWLLFAVVATTAVFLFVLRMDFSFSAGDLIDTDGYMRFLRIQDLLLSGDWFDAVSTRSNYPRGETLHWTRPLDALVAALALVITPILGDSSLYVAAVTFGPISLIVLAAGLRWAFEQFLPDVVRPVLMPALLALPLVVGYAVPGRVDHHALLFVLFVFTVGGTLRVIHRERPHLTALVGALLAGGIWTSPEFLVPVALVAVTFGLSAISSGRRSAHAAIRVFAVAAAGTYLAVLAERGSSWLTIDYARVSLVHAFIMLMIGVAFAGFAVLVRDHWSKYRGLALLGAISVGCVSLVVLMFPRLLGGPFVDFHPVVKDRWLFRVEELQPILGLDAGGLLLHLAWPLLALIVGGYALLRVSNRSEAWVRVIYGWLLGYVALSLYQMRWIAFAQLLALPILVAALTPFYTSLQNTKWAVLVRPLLVAAVIGTVLAANPLAAAEPVDTPAGMNCDLASVIPTLGSQTPTTLLAEQDAGPQVMYRTDHNVVATPYGSEEAFLYTLDLMSARDVATVPSWLEQRDIGLILICPGRIDIMQPEERSGTFYEALVAGPLPDFVRPLSLPEETDYLLFAVET